ncbi:hypothetical protein DSL64_21310 [Dyadobacter luteus]|uniref:Uncharacterized protein n=1 Tax=Dyadobacter luteus TaxID=2259619 RepID=A0A3D8Y6J7_9BACT|nr:hypothetical protein DSL64_21310 [Dyadobacter luteus]
MIKNPRLSTIITVVKAKEVKEEKVRSYSSHGDREVKTKHAIPLNDNYILKMNIKNTNECRRQYLTTRKRS